MKPFDSAVSLILTTVTCTCVISEHSCVSLESFICLFCFSQFDLNTFQDILFVFLSLVFLIEDLFSVKLSSQTFLLCDA